MVIVMIVAMFGLALSTGPGDYVSTNTNKSTQVYEPPGSIRR